MDRSVSWWSRAVALVLMVCCEGLSHDAAQTVVVYSVLDREFSEAVLKHYAQRGGVRVLPKFDVESTKTVGLTNQIIAEARRPRCDLFWNNEILNTLRLKEKGLLVPFRLSRAADLPATFPAKDGTWYGFAARARILFVNKQVALAAGSGPIAIGLTDTDDAMGEIGAGSPVSIIYPDREPDGLGTLFIPNTLAVINGAPHQKEAEALANHLLSPEVASALARGPSTQIPLLKSTNVDARVETLKTVHAMEADFEAAARVWDKVAAFLVAEFGVRGRPIVRHAVYRLTRQPELIITR